jgi:hypothetical protein
VTDVEFAALCERVHAAPKPILEAANPKWIVHDRFIRPQQSGTPAGNQYMGLMQSEKDNNRINAVHYAFAGNTPNGQVSPATRSTDREIHLYFGFFLEYGVGTGTQNNEQEFRANINRSIWRFFTSPWLGLDNTPADEGGNPISKHRQLVVPPSAQVIPVGDKWAYWAEGSLAVELQRFNR